MFGKPREGGVGSERRTIADTSHLRTGLKKRALVGAGFSVFAQTTNYAIQTVGTIIMARLLSPDDFGLVSMVAIFSILIQNFGVNGFTEAVVQREELTHHQMSKLFWINFLIMSALTILFILMSPFLVWFYGEPQLKGITTALAFSISFSGFSTCHMALLSRNMRFDLSSIAVVLAALVSTGLGIITALKGIGLWSLVLRRVSLPLVTAIFAWLFCRWRPSIPPRGTAIKPMLAFGYKTYGNFLLSYLRNNLDKILVGKAFGKASLGHYDRACQLSSVLPNQLTIALSRVGISTLSKLRQDPARYLSYFSKSLSILALIGFPGSVLFTLMGKDLIILLLGAQWSTAGDIFVALGPGIGIFVIYNMSTWLHISLGRADRLLKWSVVVIVASVLFYSLGLLFGPMGVAVAYSALFYILLIPALWYGGKPLEIRASYYLGVLWKYWAAAFASGAIYWLCVRMVGPVVLIHDHLSALPRIILGTVLYTLLYLGLIGIIFKGFNPLVMLFSLLKDMISRESPRA